LPVVSPLVVVVVVEAAVASFSVSSLLQLLLVLLRDVTISLHDNGQSHDGGDHIVSHI
jgi:hypothetical protein